jgi:hypothetical protein
MWQYTESAVLDSQTVNLDRDRFNGETDGLSRLWSSAPTGS